MFAKANLFLLELLAILTISEMDLFVGWPRIPTLAFVRSDNFKLPVMRTLFRTRCNVLPVPTNCLLRCLTHFSKHSDWSWI